MGVCKAAEVFDVVECFWIITRSQGDGDAS